MATRSCNTAWMKMSILIMRQMLNLKWMMLKLSVIVKMINLSQEVRVVVNHKASLVLQRLHQTASFSGLPPQPNNNTETEIVVA